jgi:protein-tyrosine-phosphatase
MAIKPRVLFLCTENACHSQMAEAFLRELAVSSAPTKKVDPYLRERFHFVITLCDRAQERSCPMFPGAIWRRIWPVASPAALEAAGLDRYVAVRHARDAIRRHVGEFVENHHRPKSGKEESAWN